MSPALPGQMGIVERNILERCRLEHESMARWVNFGMKLATGVVFKKKKKKTTGKRMSSCILLDIYPTFPLAKNKQKISWAPWAIPCEEEPEQHAWFEAQQKEEETWTASEMEEERDHGFFHSKCIWQREGGHKGGGLPAAPHSKHGAALGAKGWLDTVICGKSHDRKWCLANCADSGVSMVVFCS